MKLDLSSLKKAIDSLETAIEISKDLMQGKNKKIDNTIRAGVIQNFEFTYELAWKFMSRWLSINYSPSVSNISKKELFRIALQHNIIDNFENWSSYNDARNITSHTYDDINAENVFNVSKTFLMDVKKILEFLEQHND